MQLFRPGPFRSAPDEPLQPMVPLMLIVAMTLSAAIFTALTAVLMWAL